jgi:mono/diheme cytochrome c family protein
MFVLINACKNEGVLADQMQKIPFSDVQRVYTDYCIRCHSGGGGEGGNLDFTNYNGIIRTVTPGNSSNSKSYQAMIQTFQRMPPNNAVPTNGRTVIRLWIEQGANPE